MKNKKYDIMVLHGNEYSDTVIDFDQIYSSLCEQEAIPLLFKGKEVGSISEFTVKDNIISGIGVLSEDKNVALKELLCEYKKRYCISVDFN